MNPTLTLLRFGRGHRMWLRAQFEQVARSIAGWFAAPAAVPVRVRAARLPLLFAVAALALGLSGHQAFAQDRWRDQPPSYGPYSWNLDQTTLDGQLVDVQLLVRGRPQPLFSRPGIDRSYFQAFEGQNYALRLRNNTGERVGVLITVDGLNVVNGEQSDLAANEPMYVLDPWESATIAGWRSSQSEVRRFVFVDEERSYANRTDQANGDMGWIRVHAFREYQPQTNNGWGKTRSFYRDGGEAPPSSAAPELNGQSQRRDMSNLAPNEQGNPGTGWGERRYDPVRRVWFQPEPYATDQMVLRYEYESGLRALGIYPRRGNRTWQRERGELGYAQPPRW